MEIGFISRHSIDVKLTGIKEFNCADRGPESNQAVAPVCDGCDVDTAIQKVSEFREGFTSFVKTQSERGKKSRLTPQRRCFPAGRFQARQYRRPPDMIS